jgi:putative restriction endonuclease
VAELADYLDLTVGRARQQFRELMRRSPVSSGRQAVFLPIETLLCLAVSFQINHRRFGGSTAHLAPEPIPSLARLFSRPPSSILVKMANLDGSRSHGGKWDILAGAMLRDEPAHFTRIYRTLLTAARSEGIGADRLPDFLSLEHGGEFDLLGQDELSPSALENAFQDQSPRPLPKVPGPSSRPSASCWPRLGSGSMCSHSTCWPTAEAGACFAG